MYAHCKQKYGINIVLAKFESDVPLVEGADFKTGNIVDNVGGKNGVYTGTASNGSVDGTVEKNYKSNAIHLINKKTDHLIGKGYTHGGVNFKVEHHDQLNALGRLGEYLLLKLNDVTDGMTGKTFRGEGETYTFTSDADFLTWFQTGAAIVETHVQAGAALKEQVEAAENSEAAIAPILVSNAARV